MRSRVTLTPPPPQPPPPRAARGAALRRRRAQARGVTLVELMIVVAIVGVLAMIGLVGWRKLMNTSHTAEATHIVGAIRERQEAYHAEVGHYANVSKGLAYNTQGHSFLYPHLGREPGNYKVATGAPCGSACNVEWSTLGVDTDGPVFFGYTSIAGAAGTPPAAAITIGATPITWPASPPNDWYLATAVGDVDGNGVFCTVVGSSFDNMIRIDKEGE